jgi:undecaprenyl-diphosphatase
LAPWKGSTALDQLFYGFDTALYTFFWHFQNPVTVGLSNICQHMGDTTAYIIYLAIALILCFPKKTRRYGVAMVVAFLVAFLLVNVLIKPGVGRLRPYVTLKDTPFWETYQTHWAYAGSHLEDDLSFPSGHTSLNFATFTALAAVLIKDKKKWAWLRMIIPIIVGFTRIIRCVHYPSDVLGGMIIGIIAGLIGFVVVTKLLPVISRNGTGKNETGDGSSFHP